MQLRVVPRQCLVAEPLGLVEYQSVVNSISEQDGFRLETSLGRFAYIGAEGRLPAPIQPGNQAACALRAEMVGLKACLNRTFHLCSIGSSGSKSSRSAIACLVGISDLSGGLIRSLNMKVP